MLNCLTHLTPSCACILVLSVDPFSLDSVPGYLDVVSKKLDLKTLSANLEAGMYNSRQAFFDDASMIFNNAIKYHGTRETKWIAKPAKEMLKVVQRELKNLDKRPSKILTKQKAGSLKLKMKKEPGAEIAGAGIGHTAPTIMPPDVKPKVTLKLKTGGATKSKDKIVAAKAKPTQPKLKLKLSLSKKVEAPVAATTGDETKVPGIKQEKTAKTTKIKLSGPRGKELPEGVTAPTTTKKTNAKSTIVKAPAKAAAAAAGKATKKGATKKTTTKKTKKAATSLALSPSSIPGGAASMMTPVRKAQCAKILAGLKRRKAKSVAWFIAPVSDKNIIQDYRAKIKHPVCISGIQSKLDKNEYKTVAQFVLDIRRIFANCLRFNTSMKDRLRPLAVDLQATAEDLMTTFLVRGQKLPTGNPADLYPPLLYCWSFCIKVLNTLFNLTNPVDGQPTVLYFLHPVTMYCGGQYPPDYLNLVKRPMDFGTITSKYV